MSGTMQTVFNFASATVLAAALGSAATPSAGEGGIANASRAPEQLARATSCNTTLLQAKRSPGERCTHDCQCATRECKGFRCVTRDYNKHPLLGKGTRCSYDGDCRSCACTWGKCE